MANKSKESNTKKMITTGCELLESGNYVEAKDIFEKLYESHPDNKEIQNYLGMVLFKLGLHTEAASLYKKLLDKVPNFPSLYLNLGIIYYKEGLLELAHEQFLKTLEFAPNNKRASNYLGLIYMNKEEFDKALKLFEQTGSKKMITEVKSRIKQAKQGAKGKPKGKPKVQAPEVKELVLEEYSGTGRRGVEKDAEFEHDAAAKEAAILPVSQIARKLKRETLAFADSLELVNIYDKFIKFNITDEVYTRLSLIESFSGNLNFKGANKIISKKETDILLGDPGDPIIRVSGGGSLVLCTDDHSITPFALESDTFYVKEEHLLAFEKNVKYENPSKEFSEDFELIKLNGTGVVVLISNDELFTHTIDAQNPLAIKLEYVIGWYGELRSRIIKGKNNIFKRREDTKWVTFKGEGSVFCHIKVKDAFTDK